MEQNPAYKEESLMFERWTVLWGLWTGSSHKLLPVQGLIFVSPQIVINITLQ